MIGNKQYERIYSKFFLRILKEGKIPTFEEVTLLAGDKLPSINNPDEPIFQFKSQQYKSIFDVKLYNESIEDIGIDLSLLFEDFDEITQQNIRRVLHSNLFHEVHQSELRRLTNTLDALLFSTDGGDEHFFVKFEDFSDFSKTDAITSTNGIVNTAENIIALPIGLQGALKIDMSHLEEAKPPFDWTISRTDILTQEQQPGTIFGNIVKDTIYPWSYSIVAENNGPMEISFTIRLKHEEFINRITLVHFGYKPTLATIRTSVDKQNIKDLQDYSDGVSLKSQSILYSFDFEDTLVDYIHIILKKEEADTVREDPNTGVKKYTYDFGIRNISVYSTGRINTAIYQSKPFNFSEDLSAIGKVSIKTSESITKNTSIDWFILTVDKDNLLGSPIPISPENHSLSSGPAKIIILQDVLNNSSSFFTDYSNIANIDNFNNINYWRIQTLTKEPVFGTSKLYRGYKSWFRDRSEAVNPVLVKDNYITFSKGDTQTLYNIAAEFKDYVITDLNGESVPTVVLNKKPLYNPSKGHFLIPEIEINTDKDTQPNYAIYSASLNLDNTSSVYNFTFEGGSSSSGGPNVKDTGQKLINYINPGDVTLSRADGSYTYLDGVDYIVRLSEEGYATGVLVGLHSELSSPTLNGETEWQPVKLSYNIDTDLTKFVNEISGHQVYFDLSSNTLPSNTSILVRYRHSAERILKASVKAKSSYGILANDLYVQGIDYIFDSVNGTIQRLTTGSIDSGEDIYVDYKFNDLSDQLEQFFIWVKVDDPQGKSISTTTKNTGFLSKESSLVPNYELGEGLFANIPGIGLIDLSSSTEWPLISGWVQFVVKSITPTIENNALINQVIKLKDSSGKFIFVQGGKYFDVLTAIRDPLVQVSYPFLKNGVLKNDHSKFSVREVLGGNITYEVIVNFQPNTDENLYSFIPNSVPGTVEDEIVEISEEWELKWSTTEENSNSISSLVVQAVLNKTKSVDGNITPKANNYFLKVGF